MGFLDENFDVLVVLLLSIIVLIMIYTGIKIIELVNNINDVVSNIENPDKLISNVNKLFSNIENPKIDPVVDAINAMKKDANFIEEQI